MLHRKLLLRRLACVPWLLALGLVLGWSGEAVADQKETSGEAGHSGATEHKHATDPYLSVRVQMDPAGGTADSVFVNWSTSYAKNFHGTNGAAATSYTVNLYPGEIPADITDTGISDITATATGTERTGENVNTHNDVFTADFDNVGLGFYWVRMVVEVADVDAGSGEQTELFAKQIVVKPDYMLSVSPTSVREDATRRPTDITVKVVKDGAAALKSTPVTLQLASNQAETNRFSISAYPTLTIPKGEKEATGTIRFTPIRDETGPDDDLLVTLRTKVAGATDGAADIRLVDVDKESYYVNLSFSKAQLNKRDPATDIVVTATLDGKPLEETVRISLTIDKDYERTNDDAAERDTHYNARMATVLIRRGAISGRATINIRPMNAEEITTTRSLKVIASTNPIIGRATTTTTDDRTITVNGALIGITGDPSEKITGLTAAPFSIREDAESKEVTLEVVLQNPLATDERVQFNFEDGVSQVLKDRLGGDFEEARIAERDGHYHVSVQPLTIRKGETKGTTTMTVTVSNDRNPNDPRAFTVKASVGGSEYVMGILITDDDSTSESITLEVDPDEISESADRTPVTVKGILHGKEFGEDVIVQLIIDTNPKDRNSAGEEVDVVEATRDLDYTATLGRLTIPAGSTEGTATIYISPVRDTNAGEGDEKIRLKSLGQPEADDEDGIVVKLTVNHVDITLKDAAALTDTPQPGSQDPTKPAFAADAAIADQSYTAGTAIDPLVLPEATGGDAPLTYSIFSLSLPAGLVFDPATRTLSGTPAAATDAPVTVLYTVIDSDRDAASPLTFSITVAAAEVPPPVADAELTATPSSIREDAGTTQIALIVSLMAARDTAERITFTIVGPSEGKAAVRDVDYEATLGSVVTIPAGSTVGSTTLTLTPTDNTKADGLRALGVQAIFASGATLVQNIEIADDETPSTSVELSASPNEISEQSAATTVTVTATLDGQTLAEAVNVILSIDAASTATRDADYAATFNPLIQIPANSITGSTQLTVEPIDDDLREGTEIIKLTGMVINNGLTGDEVEIMLTDQAMPSEPEDPEDPPEDPEDSSLAFSGAIDSLTYTAGVEIDPLMLPGASGGTGALTYSLVGTLPAGLAFDAATRTLSGTPSAATDGAVSVTYIVTDEDGSAKVLIFSITVEAGMSTSFGFADAEVADQTYTAGSARAPLVLPAASGGTGALTYRLVGLPTGLSFDAATRTVSGTPSAATDGAVEVSYIVTDEGGSIDFLTFNITVNKALSFDGLGFGKIVPTASHDVVKIREFVVGQRVEDFALPEGTGGIAPLTYSLSPALPAGLTFDATTRTIAGTPRVASEVVYTYTVTDANGATASLSLQTLPAAFSLADNFPNPFNPVTTIKYALPQAADVELTVYNVVGQPVRTLVAEHQSAGRYAVEWDATNDSGYSLSSGMYFYRLETGGEFHEFKKMLLIK